MRKTVMLVDDSISLRQAAGVTLRRAGYEVIESRDGSDALDILQTSKNKKIHLIISDVNMPNMDGICLVKEIKKHPIHCFTPIIILTTQGHEKTKAAGREAGANAWITKPFNSVRLLDAVSKLIMD